MSDKTYTVVGYSTNAEGKTRFRVANNLKQRQHKLRSCGEVIINLIEMPLPMTRTQAAEWYKEQVAGEPDAGSMHQTV
jgi:hypothetical protein